MEESVLCITALLPGTPIVTTRTVRFMSAFDYVIVGGGTAGCVVASRLSEDPDVRVLLIEAGHKDATDAMSAPAQWLTLAGSDVDWGFHTVPQAGLDNAVLPYARGRVLGGSSGINAMAHVRADRSSYDNWVSAGAVGWGFDDLLPYFRRSENAPARNPLLRWYRRTADGATNHQPAPRGRGILRGL
jgi:choline dehydrogenase